MLIHHKFYFRLYSLVSAFFHFSSFFLPAKLAYFLFGICCFFFLGFCFYQAFHSRFRCAFPFPEYSIYTGVMWCVLALALQVRLMKTQNLKVLSTAINPTQSNDLYFWHVSYRNEQGFIAKPIGIMLLSVLRILKICNQDTDFILCLSYY